MQEVAAKEEEQDKWFDAQEYFETPLPCHQLCDQACLPTRGTPESAGLDLYATAEQVIQPGAQAQIKTGLALALPKGTYGRIAPRSGLAWKHRIFVNAGVIDSDYRKEVLAILWNNDTTPFHIHTGD
jgi:dUTP pyrophosphatase